MTPQSDDRRYRVVSVRDDGLRAILAKNLTRDQAEHMLTLLSEVRPGWTRAIEVDDSAGHGLLSGIP